MQPAVGVQPTLEDTTLSVSDSDSESKDSKIINYHNVKILPKCPALIMLLKVE